LTYLCNIFTASRNTFFEYANCCIKTCIDFYNSLTSNEKRHIHPRGLGFLLERLTSVYFHAKQLHNKNMFLHIPLMTIDGNIHEILKKQYDEHGNPFWKKI
jgi:hypothetical protein